MQSLGSTSASLILSARPFDERDAAFVEWRLRLQKELLASAGAVSYQYWPVAPDQNAAACIARFESIESLRSWRASDLHRALLAEAAPFVEGGVVLELSGEAAAAYLGSTTTSEIVITQIKPGEETAYRAWAARIQAAQERFPGYVGSFVQPPRQNERDWTTVMRFDTPEHLDAWMNSSDRASLIADSVPMTLGFQTQRVDTSFPGWIPVDPKTGKSPNMWKTASLVLLTLYPVVMLELKFLNPLLRGWHPGLATFAGNAISVMLTTWPLMPLAIKLFHPWLFPEDQPRWLVLASPAFLCLLYIVEICVLWNLLG